MSALSQKFARIREMRKRAYDDAVEDARIANLTEAETRRFIAEADSNAIWDGEAGRSYRRFPVAAAAAAAATEVPMYKEMTYEVYKAQNK
jgi:hypothetical protein